MKKLKIGVFINNIKNVEKMKKMFYLAVCFAVIGFCACGGKTTVSECGEDTTTVDTVDVDTTAVDTLLCEM